MKIISTTHCKDWYVNVRFLDISKICHKAIPKRSETGEFLPKHFGREQEKFYTKRLGLEWYKISKELRSQTRFPFVYETLPYVLQSLKIHPQTLSYYIDPIVLIKCVQDEIIGNGVTLLTPNYLIKFVVTFIRMIIRRRVKNIHENKTPEERDEIVRSLLKRISPLLLPSCVLPTISFRGDCFIPSESEVLAYIERDEDYDPVY